MAAPAALTCPHCGSTNTQAFEDSSGRCGACGRAFRGSTPIGAMIVGEEVEAGPRVAKVRQKIRWGLFGVFGGILAYVAIPTVFLLGAYAESKDPAAYVAAVVNRSTGVFTCGGSALLVVFGLYAIWAGLFVWRGFVDKAKHLLLSGVFVAAAAAIAGLGPSGGVGIAGGALTLVGGFMVWRGLRAAEQKNAEAPAADA